MLSDPCLNIAENKTEPPYLGKFDVEDVIKLMAIVAISDFAKDYLIKQKIVPDST